MTYLEKNHPMPLVLEEEENKCWEYKTVVLIPIGQHLAMCLEASSLSIQEVVSRWNNRKLANLD
jgi:hypothetical protein